MHKPILTEYENLRKEIESIKKCITDYQGFLFAGLGVLLTSWGLTSRLHADQKLVWTTLGYIALAASLVATLMLVILVYKFVSHNRAAGYNLLLTCEVWSNDYADKEIIIWEICVNLLRAREGIPLSYIDEYEQLEKAFGETIQRNKRPSWWTETIFLLTRLFKYHHSSSWGYPVTVVRIFFFSVLALLIAGTYVHFDSMVSIFNRGYNVSGAYCLIVIVLQLVFWRHIAQRFYTVMAGSSTVASFAIRFVKIRQEVLDKFLGYIPKVHYLA